MTNIFKFNDVNIKAFRGLSNLELNSCSRINLLLGDNNVGKSSVLEALSMFKTDDPYNLFSIASNRDPSYASINGIKYLYPIGKSKIELNALTSNGEYKVSSTHQIKKVVFNKEAFLGMEDENHKALLERMIKTFNYEGKETDLIEGELVFNKQVKKFSFVKFDLITSGISSSTTKINKIIYVSPSTHFKLDFIPLTEVLKSDSYKKAFIKVLQLFDPDIEDLLYLGSDDLVNEKVPFIKKVGQDASPVSIYGDGIKKAIAIATFVALSRNGVLLIDEIETSLYYKYFYTLFSFLVKACIHFNVQLFITTHSDEVINTYIDIANETDDDTILSIFTLRKVGKKTTAAKLSGKEQLSLKQTMSMEIRE